jgi:hypothetical protein
MHIRKARYIALCFVAAGMFLATGCKYLKAPSNQERQAIPETANQNEEQAKLNQQFEAMVSEDSARTEMTLTKYSKANSYSDILGNFEKDVATRENAIVSAKSMPQTFSPKLRQGFVELLVAENDLAHATGLMYEKERDMAVERQQVNEWTEHLNAGWSPNATQRALLEHETELARAVNEAPSAAESVLACLDKTAKTEAAFESTASRQSVPYSPPAAKLHDIIRSEASALSRGPH